MKNLPINVFILLLPLLLGGCQGDDVTPLARQGVIDLSASAGALENRFLGLDGEWAFYWQQLLTPEDFARSVDASPVYLTLPGNWNGTEVQGKTLDGTGYATFRLQISPPAFKQEVALRLPVIFSAYRLWIDGRLVTVGGRVGKNAAEEIPNQSAERPRFHFTGRPVELVLQVSNFHYHDGGVPASIQLGEARRVSADQMRQWAFSWICIGTLLVMGLYHIALYAFRRKDAAPLYFGFYCLVWMDFILFSDLGDWAGQQLFGPLPAPLVYRVDNLSLVFSIPFGFAFLRRLYPREFPAWAQSLAWGVALAFTVPGVAASTLTFSNLILGFYLFTMTVILYCLFCLIQAFRKGREGAGYILFGFLLLGAAGTNDMLYDMGLIASVFLTQAGLLVYILCQALALSSRFSRAFSAVEQLSDKLARQNLALEEEMSERSRLEREVISISEEERRRLSHDLHDGLCQQLTGARLRFAALKRQLGEEKPQEWGRFSGLLDEAVSQAYDLSRGLWPVESDARGLAPAFEELTRRLSESSGVAIEFRRQLQCADCDHAALGQVYRIAQEAITNALKHARAERILVDLTCVGEEPLALCVCDNGIGRRGATLGKGGLGMRIMAYRARIAGGALEVEDAEEGGTRVSCTLACATAMRGEQSE